MKRLCIFLFSASLHAATYYVSSTGNDSNPGTASQPWLTLNHSTSSMGCGDTLIVVANGSYVSSTPPNAAPYIPNCTAVSTIQSSKWDLFSPAGYRTNPTVDGPNYGKIQIVASGPGGFFSTQVETHGSEAADGGNYTLVNLASIAGGTTLTTSSGIPGLANGSQIEFEPSQAGISMPSNIRSQQKYYVVGCTHCGTGLQAFGISPASGGPPVTGITCTNACSLGNIAVSAPLQVNVGTSTVTANDYSLSSTWVNGIPVSLAATGPAAFGTLPAPLQTDVAYYVCNLSGQSFQLCSAPGGSLLRITSVGSGPLTISNNNAPSHWAFRGLEITGQMGHGPLAALFQLGTGQESSAVVGSPMDFELDHLYLHEQTGDTTPATKGIWDNARFVNIHDSWISGFTYMEAQAINWCGSVGPTLITNNFIEAAGENTLAGGCGSFSGTANLHKTFTNNFYWKPPAWKIVTNNTSSSLPPSGPCWYDATIDPFSPGGEWYNDQPASQWYQCGSDFAWHTAGAGPTIYGAPTFKNLAEHKNLAYAIYQGNILENSWANGQSGEGFNLSAEENGYMPGMRNDHITINYNALFHVYQFAVRISNCAQVPNAQNCGAPIGWHNYQHNLTVIDPTACGITSGGTTLIGCGYLGGVAQYGGHVCVTSACYDVIAHNTIWTPDTGMPTTAVNSLNSPNNTCTFSPFLYNSVHENNIFTGDYLGACNNTNTVIAAFWTHGLFTNNVMKGGTGSGYGTVGNNTFNKPLITFPTTNATISYVNGNGLPTGDYHLAATSSYTAQNPSATFLSTDGTDLGADIDLVNMMTSGTKNGTPPWNQQAHLSVDTASTEVVFRYTAPTSAACVATIYSRPARISTNQVASVADSASSSIQNGVERNLYIAGLSPSTQYWYKLACGGGVTMVGTFWMLPNGSGAYPMTFQWPSPTAMRYSSSATMSGPTTLSAATIQTIPVPSNSVVYAQAGTTGPITVLIAP